MSDVTASDISYVKSTVVTDTTANGGRPGRTPVVPGAKYNIFPFVSKTERTSGISRYRKIFWKNSNSDDPAGIAHLLAAYFLGITNGDDRVRMGLGTMRDTQGDIATDPPMWVGSGKLNSALSGGETSIQIEAEYPDIEFVPGGEIMISNHFLASQTIASTVKPGDCVQWSSGDSEWQKIDFTTDYTNPSGLYLGDSLVYTIQSSGATSERVVLPTGLVEDESIGTGDGTTAPTISALADAANGVIANAKDGFQPVITYTASAIERTVTVENDGTLSGAASGGELDLTDGTWTTAPTFTLAPDNGTDITITYNKKFWSWSSNICTLTTDGQVANAYAAANTWVSGCVAQAEAVATFDTFVDASGIYDDTTYPLAMNNPGAEEEDWTITMTSSSAFSCSGVNSGVVGTGNTSTDFAPINPASGTPYFTLDADGWEGAPAAGNQISFKTHQGVMPIWLAMIVPAGAAAISNDVMFFAVSSQ